MSVFGELKNRNVFRSAGFYIVAAWVLLQVADVIVPATGLPPWAVTFVLYLLITGFPVILVFSWFFDVSLEGIKPGGEDAKRHLKGVTPAIAVSIMLLIMTGAGSLIYNQLSKIPLQQLAQRELLPGQASIAVLPFVNMSSDPEQDYFSDGISEEILNILAQIPNLHVTSRSSAFRYRGSGIHIPTVGAQLGVAHVLEGSVRKSGTMVRITAQLIDASEDRHLWSATYDRVLDDIFSVQDEISAAIVGALIQQLGMDLAKPIAQPDTTNIEAYEEFLLGRQLFETRIEENLEEALRHFERAVELDSEYALAWAEIGNTYRFLSEREYGSRPHDEAIAAAQIPTMRALSLDPNRAAVQASLADQYRQVGDFLLAEQTLRNIIRDYPNYAQAYHWLAILLKDHKNNELENLRLLEAAHRLDPLSMTINNLLGEQLAIRGRFEDAESSLARSSTINPNNPALESAQQKLSFMRGHYAEVAFEDGDPRSFYHRGLALVAIGEFETARQVLSVGLPYPAVSYWTQDYRGFTSWIRENIPIESGSIFRGYAEMYAGELETALHIFEAEDRCSKGIIDLIDCINLGYLRRVNGNDQAARTAFESAYSMIEQFKLEHIVFYADTRIEAVEAGLFFAEGRLEEAATLYQGVIDMGYFPLFAFTPEKSSLHAMPEWENLQAGLAKIRETQMARLTALEAIAAEESGDDSD